MTALVVRELLGGVILVATVLPIEGTPHERHAWNRLPSGLELDLTWEQFKNGERLATPEVREPKAATQGVDRFRLLSARVRKVIGLEPTSTAAAIRNTRR